MVIGWKGLVFGRRKLVVGVELRWKLGWQQWWQRLRIWSFRLVNEAS